MDFNITTEKHNWNQMKNYKVKIFCSVPQFSQFVLTDPRRSSEGVNGCDPRMRNGLIELW